MNDVCIKWVITKRKAYQHQHTSLNKKSQTKESQMKNYVHGHAKLYQGLRTDEEQNLEKKPIKYFSEDCHQCMTSACVGKIVIRSSVQCKRPVLTLSVAPRFLRITNYDPLNYR
uniref:Uncharacterized protein n=1 Tax=Glossina austeni TaxID=7395 RepID=A0A1A9ULY4_GLOAU